MSRDYKRERELYYGYGPSSGVTAKQRKHRRDKASRGRARAELGKFVNVAGKDVHHRNGNPQDNRRQNLVVVSRSKNRRAK